MKKLNFFPLLLCLLSLSSAGFAKGDWTKIDGSIKSAYQQARFPEQYLGFQLNEDAMKATLSKATLNPDQPIRLELPDAANNYRTFLVWETPVMEAADQARYPGIRTYTAVAESDPSVTAKISYTEFGFRAVVFSNDNTYMIAPYANVKDGNYLVFDQKDFIKNVLAQGHCGVSTEDQLAAGIKAQVQRAEMQNSRLQERRNGHPRHIYRAAIACTGEWAQAAMTPAPTQAGIHALIVAILHNANGVFERELSVTMTLIPENNQVEYLDPNTDPYINDGNNDLLIDENQTNFDVVYPGGTQYDIGHILNTAGGGLAQLYSICNNGGKARGVSGVPDPENFFVIIHEMGHQMASTHTFNSESGACSGNSTAETGYEPGSGTSIMSYNGMCDPDNVPGTSVNYYHVYSLDVISTNLSSINCGTTDTGAVPIQVANINATYNIPKNTPFELLAPVAEASETNPAIWYSWEQYDTGHNGEAESGSAQWDTGPVMQSFAPSENRLRAFPTMDLLVAGTYAAAGQRLPNVERSMTYRLTARSFKNGWGTFDTNNGEIKINVANKSQFRVLTPDAPALWDTFSQRTITWDTGGTRQAPIVCGFVDIYISYDGGYTFPHQIVEDAPNTGSYTLTVPNVFSDSVRFKVKGEGNVFFDISKANIQIHGDPLGVARITDNSAFNVYPNPSKGIFVFENKNGGRTDVKLSLYNVVGQCVWTGDAKEARTSINVSGLAKGNYFLKMIDKKDNKIYSKKVTIE